MKKLAEEIKVVMSCIRLIQLIRLRQDFMRRLWNVDRRKCIAATLRSHEMADFLTEHIPADRLDKVTAPGLDLAKTAPAESETRELAEEVVSAPGAHEKLLGILSSLAPWWPKLIIKHARC